MIRQLPLTALLLAVLLPALAAGSAHAQVEAQSLDGRITGEVTLGTEGATLGDDLVIDFIVLEGSDVGGTVVPDVDGAMFTLDVPLSEDRRYLPRAVYQGVSYFGAPLSVTEEQPEVVAELPPMFETTSETPDLTIEETVLTVVALDRETGELGLIREDLVVNPTDRVYVGNESLVTLRLPAPERTVDALGENADGEFALEGGVLTTTTPIRALGGTSIVTRYLVTYDVADDAYELRLTTPVAAERLVVRVPDGYIRGADVLSDGGEGPSDTFEVAEGDGVPLRTFVLEGAGPGDSLIVRLEGFAIQRNSNPLAETPGSVIAAAVALAVIVGAGAVAVVLRREPAP